MSLTATVFKKVFQVTKKGKSAAIFKCYVLGWTIILEMN